MLLALASCSNLKPDDAAGIEEIGVSIEEPMSILPLGALIVLVPFCLATANSCVDCLSDDPAFPSYACRRRARGA